MARNKGQPGLIYIYTKYHTPSPKAIPSSICLCRRFNLTLMKTWQAEHFWQADVGCGWRLRTGMWMWMWLRTCPQLLIMGASKQNKLYINRGRDPRRARESEAKAKSNTQGPPTATATSSTEACQNPNPN